MKRKIRVIAVILSLTLLFTAAAAQSETPFDPLTVTVRYLDKDGNRIAEDTIQSIVPGNNYVYPTANVPDDYELVELGVKEVFADAFGVNPPVVEFHYALKEISASVKINYVDQDGNPLIESAFYTYTFDSGEHPVFALRVEGYSVVDSSMQTVFVDRNSVNPAEITFVYERDVQPDCVTIHYVDQDGESLRMDDVQTLSSAVNVVVPAEGAMPEDYALVGPESAEVLLDGDGAHPSEVTFVYQWVKKPKSTEKPTVIASPKPSSLPYAIRKLNWGDTKEHVKEVEGDWIFDGNVDNLNASYVIYQVKVASLDCLLAYYFCDDGLFQARYILTEEHSTPSLYVDDYNTFKKALTKKYGKPLFDKEEWDEDRHKQYYNDSKGRALEYGYLSYFTTYFLDETIISMEMSADNYEIKTIIDYRSLIIDPGTIDYSDEI